MSLEEVMHEMPKHTCGNYYAEMMTIFKQTNAKSFMDYGKVHHCKKCDKFVYVESKPFGKFNEGLDLFPEEKEFSTIMEVEKFLKENELETITKIDKLIRENK